MGFDEREHTLTPDSTVTTVQGMRPNPLRSRSTLICLACLLALIAIDFMAMKSGYFDVAFASSSLVILSKMIDSALNHQNKSDEKSNGKNPPA